MTVRVVTDSACDLPEALASELGIAIVPLTIRFGNEEFVDGVSLSNDEFWRRLRSSAELPETAAPSAGAFESCFHTLADEGASAILCISLSTRLSATMQSARVAARAIAARVPVTVVDSRSCSMGLGNLCLTAARRARAGEAIDAIVRDVEDRRARTRLFGVLDTLEYLKRGGRIGNAQALLGSMLAIKPVLELRDGAVEEGGKVRTRSRAVQLLADKVHAQPVESLAVLHGQAPDAEHLVDLVADAAAPGSIVVGTVGPVIGTHAGPGVLGVTFQVTG